MFFISFLGFLLFQGEALEDLSLRAAEVLLPDRHWLKISAPDGHEFFTLLLAKISFDFIY